MSEIQYIISSKMQMQSSVTQGVAGSSPVQTAKLIERWAFLNLGFMYYVYIIFSERHQIYYKGYTEQLVKRIDDHNQGKSRYTKGKGTWELVFYRTFKEKREALIYEKKLKRQNQGYIQWLLEQSTNEFFKD